MTEPDIETREERLERLDRLAWLLDNSIKVPGTSWRIGIDGLIGLIPGFGDVAGALLSSYVVTEAARAGASMSLILRMGLNVVIETVVGVIPLVGDVFDFAFKANARNVKLLRNHAVDPAKARRQNRLVVAVAALIGVIVVFSIMLVSFAVLRWAWGVLTGSA
jgi:predicted aconitase with swiveling domain